jgi:hypothetical protein
MPDTTTALTSSHGLTLTFNGATGLIRKAQDLDFSFSDSVEDVSDLSLAEGAMRVVEPSPQLGGDELKLKADFATGTSYPKVNDEGAITCTLGTLSGWAVCTQATVVFQTAELVTLDLAFRVGDTPD